MTNKDAFDLWWEWVEKPSYSTLKISAEIREAVMALPPEERRDRPKVNQAVRDGLKLAHCAQPEVRTRTAFRRRGNRSARIHHCPSQAASYIRR
jgi:hypothetical protein